ncbi:hypothetical protein L218DRAFT_297759 [Marasmius fiardii PR-910]|nr:hypothetical protein L218DRAFT_297759 [Marasmius fiardii PR-910]
MEKSVAEITPRQYRTALLMQCKVLLEIWRMMFSALCMSPSHSTSKTHPSSLHSQSSLSLPYHKFAPTGMSSQRRGRVLGPLLSRYLSTLPRSLLIPVLECCDICVKIDRSDLGSEIGLYRLPCSPWLGNPRLRSNGWSSLHNQRKEQVSHRILFRLSSCRRLPN